MVLEGRFSLREASDRMGISYRHTKRLKHVVAVMSCCEKPKHSRTGNEALLWLAALENKNAEIGLMYLKITERPQKVWCPKNLERFPP